MSAKTILASEQRMREQLHNELDAATEALLEPQQRFERAKFRKEQYDTKLARKYVIRGDDEIDVFGNITRGKKK